MQAAEQANTWGSTETHAERHVPRLVEPEILLPGQYYELLAGKSILEGEKRLMLAILEDAVSCYQRYASANRGRALRLFEESQEWIFEENSPWVFSFESIAYALDIDPDFLREGLKRWRTTHLDSGAVDSPRFSRVRLRAARRHRILPFRERRRRKPQQQLAVA
jgi:hypothetical protein